jgi:dihydrolipoamide dehydrogenase
MSVRRVIIIGAGPAGYVAAIRASQLGAKVTLIEQDRVGGTCLNRGCIPTKALLSDAKLLRKLGHSSVFHALVPEDFNPLAAMMERKRNVVEELVKGVEILLDSHHVVVKKGRADLLGPKQVIFMDGNGRQETVEGDAIILGPGSKSKTLPNIAPDGSRIITSDEALELKGIPAEIVIIGGGYIGAEFATLFNALGSRVTLVEVLDDLLPGLEGELVRHFRRSLEGSGVRVFTKSAVDEVSVKDSTVELTVKTPQGAQKISAEKVLLSVGRGPLLDLAFSKAGIEVSASGIRVNSRMETSAASIYAIGDAVGGVLLAHVASEQAVVAAENAMGMTRELEDHPIPLSIFTYPEMASIGLTEKEARSKGSIKIGRFPFRSNPTAVISGEPEGLVKVVASRETDEILGVHIVGSGATVLISIAASMMRAGVTVGEFARHMQAHPTPPEALKEAALDVEGMAIHLPKPLRMDVKR